MLSLISWVNFVSLILIHHLLKQAAGIPRFEKVDITRQMSQV